MPRVKLFDEKEVLEKAMNLFWEKGYYSTSMDDLVKALKVNRASLYSTYGGKKQLFENALEHYREKNISGITQLLNSQDDVRTGFRKLFTMAIQQSVEDTEAKGCFVVNTTVEFIPNEKDFFSLLSDNKKEFEKIFYNYLLLGVEKGQIANTKDIRSIAALFFTFYNGLRVVTKIDTDAQALFKSVDALLMVLK